MGVLVRTALCTGLSAAGLLSSRFFRLQPMTALSCLYCPHQRLELQLEAPTELPATHVPAGKDWLCLEPALSCLRSLGAEV